MSVPEIDILRARVELLRECHELANGALRSAWSVAEREGRETNWSAYRAMLCASLDASHAAMKALDSAPRSLSWREISSAPKDGSHFLACDASIPYGSLWSFNQRPPTVVHWHVDGFYVSVSEVAPRYAFPATHWRPLGVPPMRDVAG